MTNSSIASSELPLPNHIVPSNQPCIYSVLLLQNWLFLLFRIETNHFEMYTVYTFSIIYLQELKTKMTNNNFESICVEDEFQLCTGHCNTDYTVATNNNELEVPDVTMQLEIIDKAAWSLSTMNDSNLFNFRIWALVLALIFTVLIHCLITYNQYLPYFDFSWFTSNIFSNSFVFLLSCSAIFLSHSMFRAFSQESTSKTVKVIN